MGAFAAADLCLTVLYCSVKFYLPNIHKCFHR